MSWHKCVIADTLSDQFTREFLLDLYAIQDKIDLDIWDADHLDEDELVEEIREWLFNPDHMEWCGNWLSSPDAQDLIAKHGYTGYIIFSEDGDVCDNTGFKFVDGILTSTALVLRFDDE